MSGQLTIYIPVDDTVPWYRKPFQNFRPVRHVPYRNGLIHGSVIELDPNGCETSIHQYRDGKEHGINCFFHPDSSFSHLISLKNGVMDGPRIDCWTNGIVTYNDVYSNDQDNGLSRRWSSAGVLIYEGMVSNNNRIGKHTWFYRNGAKSYEIQYSTNGIPLQTTIWKADGNLIGTGIYKDGHKWDGCFITGGKGESSLVYYSDGKYLKHGEWQKESPIP